MDLAGLEVDEPSADHRETVPADGVETARSQARRRTAAEREPSPKRALPDGADDAPTAKPPVERDRRHAGQREADATAPHGCRHALQIGMARPSATTARPRDSVSVIESSAPRV